MSGSNTDSSVPPQEVFGSAAIKFCRTTTLPCISEKSLWVLASALTLKAETATWLRSEIS